MNNLSYTGLLNLGNTCFLNSCIQVLNHTFELNELSSNSGKLLHNNEDATIFKEWEELKQLMFSNNCTVSPNKFVDSVHRVSKIKNRDLFTGWNQNDVHEFILFMLDCFHNSRSRALHMNITGKVENETDEIAFKCYNMFKATYEKDYSEIINIFYGMYVSIITSVDGNMRHSIIPENYFILDLSIPTIQNCSIYDCFDLFLKEETLSGENSWYNDKTNTKEEVKKKMLFWNFPKILTITFKRFSYDGTTKLDHLVSFPIENLDLSRYLIGYNKEKYIYDLYAVCNHYGNSNMGHYTAFIKNIKGEWIHYNDEILQKVENPENIITPMAYCLFYRKKK